MVAEVLAQTGLGPHCLDLELTESVLMDDVNSAIDTMTQLHELGVHLSIDDFGTGYSSLAYLKRFPIDTLKIDQSFVRDVVTDSNETQRHFLYSHGCRYGQGYLFSKPKNVQDIEAYLVPKYTKTP